MVDGGENASCDCEMYSVDETVAINGFLVDYYKAYILFQDVHIHYS